MFDESQLEKLLSALESAHRQNELDLHKLRNNADVKKSVKKALVSKM